MFYLTFDAKDTCCNFKNTIFCKKTLTDWFSRGISRLTISFKAYLPVQMSLPILVIAERVETLIQFSLSNNLDKFGNFLKGNKLLKNIIKNHFNVSLRHWNNDFCKNVSTLWDRLACWKLLYVRKLLVIAPIINFYFATFCLFSLRRQ